MKNAAELELISFYPEYAHKGDFTVLNAFHNAMHAESWPEDDPRPVEDTRRTYGNLSAFKDVAFYSFCLRDGEQIRAEAFMEVSQRPDNRHLAFLTLGVLPTARRQGLATRLLREVARVMVLEGRTLLMFVTEDAVPAGAITAEHLGASRGLEASTNQLEVSALDRNLLRRWQTDAPTETFELGYWLGPFPEEELEAIAELIGVMNTAPKGELSIEDVTVTPAQLRQREAFLVARHSTRWVAYVREHATHTLAGYTEMTWNPANARVFNQGDTGVRPNFRGHGLGKWLKAAMLERTLSEKPDVRYVRTGNADANAPMLRINHALGFRLRMAEVVWQVELTKLHAYLQGRT